jgi:hypothetical protein
VQETATSDKEISMPDPVVAASEKGKGILEKRKLVKNAGLNGLSLVQLSPKVGATSQDVGSRTVK